MEPNFISVISEVGLEGRLSSKDFSQIPLFVLECPFKVSLSVHFWFLVKDFFGGGASGEFTDFFFSKKKKLHMSQRVQQDML